MGAQQSSYPFRCAQPLGALRLQLAPTFAHAEMAGVWRPYSRDLTREAPHLIDDFPKGRGTVDRLVYAPKDWDVVATEVFTRRGRVKVGFLPEDEGGGIVLLRLIGSSVVRLRVEWG